MYIGLHVKYLLFLSDFDETFIFLTNFLKILKHQISRKSVQRYPEFFHTDLTNLIVAFYNFMTYA